MKTLQCFPIVYDDKINNPAGVGDNFNDQSCKFAQEGVQSHNIFSNDFIIPFISLLLLKTLLCHD